MAEGQGHGEKIDPPAGRHKVGFYVWGFGREDKARRRRIMWGESVESIRDACRRNGFTIYRIELLRPPAPAYRPGSGPEETDAGSDKAVAQRTTAGVRGTSALSDVPGD